MDSSCRVHRKTKISNYLGFPPIIFKLGLAGAWFGSEEEVKKHIAAVPDMATRVVKVDFPNGSQWCLLSSLFGPWSAMDCWNCFLSSPKRFWQSRRFWIQPNLGVECCNLYLQFCCLHALAMHVGHTTFSGNHMHNFRHLSSHVFSLNAEKT